VSDTPAIGAVPSAVLFLGALLVRVGMMDGSRMPDAAALDAHIAQGWVRRLTPFVGHEDLLLRAFSGDAPDPSSQAWPLAIALAQGLGLLTHDPRALLVVSVVSGALAAVGVAAWTGRHFGRVAGLWAGVLVALLAEHAAWSTSAYPVMPAHALLVGAFVVRSRWGAALLIGLACSLRPDLAPVALLRGLPGLVGLPVAAAWVLLLPTPSLTSPLQALSVNWPMVRYLGPPVLALGVLGLGDRRAWGLLGAALLVHVAGSGFADYGARHALLGGVVMCALVGVAADRWGHIVGLAVALGLASDTASVARVWHHPVVPAAATLDLGPPPPDCVEVTEEPPIPGQPLPSYLQHWRGELVADCVMWGEEDQHSAWTSRGLRDRALRMRTLYQLEPLGQRTVGRDRVRVYHRLERRP
jgi:hypothetical protein